RGFGFFCLAGRGRPRFCRSSSARRGTSLRTRCATERGARHGLERPWHSRSHCRHHDRLYYIAFTALWLRAAQRADRNLSACSDTGLSRAPLTAATSLVAGKAARLVSEQEQNRDGRSVKVLARRLN